jgi:hypothetical protein
VVRGGVDRLSNLERSRVRIWSSGCVEKDAATQGSLSMRVGHIELVLRDMEAEDA